MLFRLALAVVSGFVAAAAPGIAQIPPPRALSPEAALDDVRLARRAIETIHPGLDRYGAPGITGAAFDVLERESESGITDQRLYALLSAALASVRCSHTKAEPWKEWTAARETGATYFPLRFREESGRMLVARSASPAIIAADEVIAIDGVPAGVIMATILNAVPADGWTDGARRFALFNSSDLDECEFDHYYPFYFGGGGERVIEVRTAGATRSRLARVSLVTRAARREALRQPAAARNLDESITLTFPQEGVALLRIGTFVAYRKQLDPETIYRPYFEEIATKGAASLIIDLRSNGGGSDEAALDLLRFIAKEPFAPRGSRWVKAYRFGDLRDKLETWDPSVLDMPDEAFRKLENGYYEVLSPQVPAFAPLAPAFTGRVIALCGPANASGATLCLATMRSRFGVTLAGEPTGGSADGPTAGIIFFVTLPNSGIRVRVPAIRSVSGMNDAAAAGGLTPDVDVRSTLADELAGRDPVLEAALGLAQRR